MYIITPHVTEQPTNHQAAKTEYFWLRRNPHYTLYMIGQLEKFFENFHLDRGPRRLSHGRFPSLPSALELRTRIWHLATEPWEVEIRSKRKQCR